MNLLGFLVGFVASTYVEVKAETPGKNQKAWQTADEWLAWSWLGMFVPLPIPGILRPIIVASGTVQVLNYVRERFLKWLAEQETVADLAGTNDVPPGQFTDNSGSEGGFPGGNGGGPLI